MGPIVFISAELYNKKCKHRQTESNGNVPGNVYSQRSHSQQVQQEDEKENGEQEAHVFSVFGTDVRNSNLIANVDNQWLQNTVETGGEITFLIVLCQAAEHKKQDEAHQNHRHHVLG